MHQSELLLPLLALEHHLITAFPLLLYHLVGPRVVPPECLPVSLPQAVVIDLHVVLELALGGHAQRVLRVLLLAVFGWQG
jgi:hypothetical protein